MREHFLHFVWQFQYFNKTQLQTVCGQPIDIIRPGFSNANAGPDFSMAHVNIGSTEWHGNIEIHYRSAEWRQHKHQHDAGYNNVVLHVVWQHNEEAQRNDGTQIPVLELHNRIDPTLIDRYERLVKAELAIPCADQLAQVPKLVLHDMLDRSLVERLEQRTQQVAALLKENGGDWEETTWQLLAKNFGFKTNSDAFFRLAQTLPLNTLARHANSLTQLEALLFGQAGLLAAATASPYVDELKREYHLLAAKYQLTARQLNPTMFKFLRLRPANFPTVRLAQLAAFLHRHTRLFSVMLNTQQPKDLLPLFKVNTSAYWQNHYHFKNPSQPTAKVPTLGKASIENIMINTVAPIMFYYGMYAAQDLYTDRAQRLLQVLAPEKNHIITKLKWVGLPVDNAADSQGALQLHNQYCAEKRCLSCKIGTSLLAQPTMEAH